MQRRADTFPVHVRTRPSLTPMSTYPVRVFGDPVLKQKAKDVTDLDGALARFVDTMVDTMYEASGVGLAAPQVGVQKRMFTFDVGEGPQVLINPEVAEATGEWVYEEGCLSIPGFREDVRRALKVRVRAQNMEGEFFEIHGEVLLARAMQHELDHLNGILFINHISPLKRDLIRRKIRKLVKAGEWE